MRNPVKNKDSLREKFIYKALKRHGYKYDYSEVEYINSIEKVKIICKEHGSFFVRPDAHVRKVGCPSCNGGVKYNNEIFINLAIEKHGNKFDYSKVNYINSSKKIEVICKYHGPFNILPSNHLLGQSCSSCAGVKRKNNIEFINESNKIHNNMYGYSNVDYKNNRTKVEIICSKHGSFFQSPKDHLNGHGCNLCNFSKGEMMIAKCLTSLNIKFIREYKFENCVGDGGRKLPFDFYLPKYNICLEYDGRHHYEIVDKFGGDEYFDKVVRNDFIKNTWCEKNGVNLFRIKFDDYEKSIKKFYTFLEKVKYDQTINNIQKSEFNIKSYLDAKDNFIIFIKNIYKNNIIIDFEIEEYRYDIFLPDIKLGINFIGIFSGSNINVDKNHHLNMNNKFKLNGFKLIQVFEDQWIYKREIVESRILSMLYLSKKVYARKCEIREIRDTKIVSQFLIKNHIQGNLGSSIKLGLYYNNELISLMTFGKLRKNLGQKSEKNSYELLRFCNKLNYVVVGAASRLFKYFLDIYNPNRVISYADKMWSNQDSMYSKIGMNYFDDSKPSYYHIIGAYRKNRFLYRKDVFLKMGFDKSLSEYEICNKLGICRIYDCGSIKFMYKKRDVD